MSGIREGIDPRTQPSFSLRNRLGRVLWTVVGGVLFRASPRPFHAWRAFVLRCFGAKVGTGCHVYPGVRIWAPWNLVIDDQAGIADGAILYSMATITIGRQAVISQGAHLCAASHDYEDANFQLFAKPISVGAQAWIAAEAFIGPGVTIGEGAVVGARSLVVKDAAPWTVHAGVPAKAVKPRVIRQAGKP